MDAHRKRHLNQDYLTPGNKREGAYGCCLDLIASQNTSEITNYSDPTMPNVCPRGAIQTGAAAEVAALSKERAWTAQAEAQGGTFYPLAIEAGGTLNARFQVSPASCCCLFPVTC